MARSGELGSARNCSMAGVAPAMMAQMIAVEQFPRRIRMTFGGCPWTALRCRKSSSLLTIDPADGLRPASRSGRCTRKGSLPLGGKQKARANVVKLKFGKVADNIRFGHTRSEVLKNIRDRDAHPANDRLSSSDVWLHGDARAPIHTEKDTCSRRVEQT